MAQFSLSWSFSVCIRRMEGLQLFILFILPLLGDLFYALKTTLLGSGKACVLDFEWYSKTLTPRQSCACGSLGIKAPSLYGAYPVCEA